MLTPQLKIRILKKNIHSFYFFGAVGYTLGLLLGLLITYRSGLELWPTLFCGITGAGVLIGLTLLYKKITGREDLVYYQHELAILACCLILLLLLNQPVLQYLDITLIGIGVFLVFGRIGCFSVGCCHGRPHKKGVLYSKAHVAEGFPNYYQGIRVFPIQLIESVSALIIVIVGVYLILSGSAPGTTLLVYSIIYGLIRFVLEFFRGDAERPYWLDFSEAQWTTLGIFLLSIILSFYSVLPYYTWHLLIVGGLVIFLMGTAAFRNWKKTPTHRILRPVHVSEVARGIEALDTHIPPSGELLIAHTSLGLKISKGKLKIEHKIATHYSISTVILSTKKSIFKLNLESAEVIGNLIRTLKHAQDDMEIVKGNSDIFHIIFTGDYDGNDFSEEINPSIALGLRRDLRYTYN